MSAASHTIVTRIVELAVLGFVLWLAYSASRQSRRSWLWTLLWGVVFGFLVEYYNIHPIWGGGCIYSYPKDSPALSLLGIPVWVPIGWGGILYAATWTAQRIQHSWWLRPFTAAGLAVNMDVSLDPVAQIFNFWHWNWYRVSFCGVPFDNYLGWYLIVFIYALCGRGLLSLFSKREDGKRPEGKIWKDFIVSGIAAAVAFVVYETVKYGLSLLPAYHADADGSVAGWIFIGVTVFVATITGYHALRGKRSNGVQWAVLVVPATLQALWLVLLVFSKQWKLEPALLVLIPANLLIGFFMFAWPSLDNLLGKFGSPAPAASIPPPAEGDRISGSRTRGPNTQHAPGSDDAKVG